MPPSVHFPLAPLLQLRNRDCTENAEEVPMSRTIYSALTALALAAGGCAHAEEVAAPIPEAPLGSSYRIPAAEPHGTVNVMSLGAEQLSVPSGQPNTYLHLRLAVENESDTVAWTAAAADQTLSMQGASLSPAFGEASGGGPLLTVQPHGRGTLDVFFALAGGVEPPALSLDWRVRRGSELVAQTTNFQRPTSVATYNQYGQYGPYSPLPGPAFYLGVGPAWWYDGWGWYGAPFAYRTRPLYVPAPVYLYPHRPVYVPRAYVGHPTWGGGRGFAGRSGGWRR
jgi:hypothetical protein